MASKRKKVNYELIERYDDKRARTLSAPYRLMEQIKEAHHPHLSEARIALPWRKELNPDADGLLVLGKCKKVSDLDRQLEPFDFIVILNKEAWGDFDDRQKAALLDHELCHASISTDKDGEPKRDTQGRIVYRLRKHDVEEFREIVARNGLYKSDLEAFFRSLKASEAIPLFAGQPQEGIAGKVGT